MHGFAGKTVPICYGNEDVADIFNEKSFINAHKYKNLDEVVKAVIEIEENQDLWTEMISTPCFLDENYPTRKRKEFKDNFFVVLLLKILNRLNIGH